MITDSLLNCGSSAGLLNLKERDNSSGNWNNRVWYISDLLL